MPNDAELLRRYSELGSQEAFQELVESRINLVYSIALRQVSGNSHLAEEAAQRVFEDLARKASDLTHHSMLTGWLFTSTRYAANHLMRAERRRRTREILAVEEDELASDRGRDETEWTRLAPILDRVLEQLPERDRLAILLRYYEDRPYAEIGKAIAVSEDGARMRVQRALERLRARLEKHGIRSTSTALAALLVENAIGAAPSGLAAHVAAASVVSITAPATLGVIHLMSTTKTIGILATIAALGTVGGLEWRENIKLSSERHELALEHERLSFQEHLLNERIATTAQDAKSGSSSELSGGKKPPAQRESASKSSENSQKDPANRKRFARFFKQRGLGPEQIDRFIDLLNQQADARADLQEAVRKEGLPDGPQIEAMRSELYRPITDALKQLLGDDGYSAFVAFEQTSFYQSVWVQPLENHFLAENVPIDEAQEVQLTEIVASNNHPVKIAPTDLGGESTIDWDAVVTQAASFLTPTQLSVLQNQAQLLKSQQDQNIARLRALRSVTGNP